MSSDWTTPYRRTRHKAFDEIRRVGIVPFFLDENKELSFLMGRDYSTGDITDFGGGRKKGEKVIRCARREFSEETNTMFNIHDKTIHFSLRNRSTFIYFVRFSLGEIQRGVSLFKPSPSKPEILSLMCLPLSRLRRILTRQEPLRVYDRIVMLIKRAVAPAFASLLLENCFQSHSYPTRYPYRYIKEYDFLSSRRPTTSSSAFLRWRS